MKKFLNCLKLEKACYDHQAQGLAIPFDLKLSDELSLNAYVLLPCSEKWSECVKYTIEQQIKHPS